MYDRHSIGEALEAEQCIAAKQWADPVLKTAAAFGPLFAALSECDSDPESRRAILAALVRLEQVFPVANVSKVLVEFVQSNEERYPEVADILLNQGATKLLRQFATVLLHQQGYTVAIHEKDWEQLLRAKNGVLALLAMMERGSADNIPIINALRSADSTLVGSALRRICADRELDKCARVAALLALARTDCTERASVVKQLTASHALLNTACNGGRITWGEFLRAVLPYLPFDEEIVVEKCYTYESDGPGASWDGHRLYPELGFELWLEINPTELSSALTAAFRKRPGTIWLLPSGRILCQSACEEHHEHYQAGYNYTSTSERKWECKIVPPRVLCSDPGVVQTAMERVRGTLEEFVSAACPA